MAFPKVDFEVGADGVAVITMGNPPVNALAIPSQFDSPILHSLAILVFYFIFFYFMNLLCVMF